MSIEKVVDRHNEDPRVAWENNWERLLQENVARRERGESLERTTLTCGLGVHRTAGNIFTEGQNSRMYTLYPGHSVQIHVIFDVLPDDVPAELLEHGGQVKISGIPAGGSSYPGLEQPKIEEVISYNAV